MLLDWTVYNYRSRCINFLSSQEFARLGDEVSIAHNIQCSVLTINGFGLQPKPCVPRRDGQKMVAISKIYILLSISVIIEVEITPVSVSLQQGFHLSMCYSDVG